MKKNELNLIIAGLLVLAIGVFSGYSLGYYRGALNRFPQIKQVGEINPGATTLRIEGLKNGVLIGSVSGQDIRLVMGDGNIQSLPKDQNFEIPITAVGVKAQPLSIPADAQFVASRKGKYYYTLFDPRGMEIVSENRIYFATTAEAEAQGYQKPSTPP